MRILISILLFSFAFSQEYCAGDVISSEHQAQTFDVCYPCDTCEPWSLSQYAGDILFLDMSASWCAPCFSAIDFIDQLEEYWTDQNPNVKFVTALSDIDEPYSCNEWGNAGTSGSPLIVEDDGRLFDWFHDSNGQYPSYVLIDHEMRVRAKPSSAISNSNLNECDGSVEDISSFDGGCLNEMITQLLDECGEDCSSGAGCSDESACNNGENTDCIYADDNHDCCGECTAEIDCAGICGGDATEDDCQEETGDCPTCIIVPSEHFATVQEGINAAVDGDTVLVEPGIYYENLVIQKSITLASRAIFDDLSSWVGYTDEYVVLNDNINATVLDGSLDTNGDGLESVILIDSPSDECIEPLIFGFTITGGNGTAVMVEVDDGESARTEVEQIRGGGFLSRNALPNFKYNAIVNNKGTGDDKVHSGGGGEESNGDQIRMRETRGDYTWGDGRTECSGDIDLSYNLYSDNDATYGNTFSTLDFEGTIDMSNSIFDVYDCPEEEVNTVWVDVEDEVEVDFSYGVGDLCSITDDVWVSPGGDDNNLGTSESEAFLTIGRALEMIAPDDDDPVTINLTEGTFSPSTTGEEFPIYMISNVNLIGQGEEFSILDAEGSAENERSVIRIENCNNNIINNLTLSGGFLWGSGGSGPEVNGGGILIMNSNALLLSDLNIRNNHARTGGGIYIYESSPTIENVHIFDNSAQEGAGISCSAAYPIINGSYPLILNSIISNNRYDSRGGGIHCKENSNLIIENVIISDNYSESLAQPRGGGMYFTGRATATLNFVEISGNSGYHGGGIFFSLNSYAPVPIISNTTISNNTSTATYQGGGGIYSVGTSPILENVSIIDNNSNYDGGGIYFNGENLNLENVIFYNNSSQHRGGGIYSKNNSNIILNAVSMHDNSANNSGGGIYSEDNTSLEFSSVNRSNIYSNIVQNRGFGGGYIFRIICRSCCRYIYSDATYGFSCFTS